MEWIETTGRTVDEAKERALDELGVDETDAEFDVVAEPGIGLFGRLRSEARVRARVMPTAPRAKEDRRDRRRRGSGAGASSASSERPTGTPAGVDDSPDAASVANDPAVSTEPVVASKPSRGADRSPGGRERTGTEPHSNGRREGNQVEVAMDEQGRIAEEFLHQLALEFGVAATVTRTQTTEDAVDLQVEGSDLGLLIGPKGTTLLAIQDLTRTVVHHRTGAGNGRLHVDVGGYRRRRSEALSRFAVQVATTVRQSGDRTALEPMSAADRKVVHDALTDFDGVPVAS